jgi:hypothetical protein
MTIGHKQVTDVIPIKMRGEYTDERRGDENGKPNKINECQQTAEWEFERFR